MTSYERSYRFATLQLTVSVTEAAKTFCCFHNIIWFCLFVWVCIYNWQKDEKVWLALYCTNALIYLSMHACIHASVHLAVRTPVRCLRHHSQWRSEIVHHVADLGWYSAAPVGNVIHCSPQQAMRLVWSTCHFYFILFFKSSARRATHVFDSLPPHNLNLYFSYIIPTELLLLHMCIVQLSCLIMTVTVMRRQADRSTSSYDDIFWLVGRRKCVWNGSFSMVLSHIRPWPTIYLHAASLPECHEIQPANVLVDLQNQCSFSQICSGTTQSSNNPLCQLYFFG